MSDDDAQIRASRDAFAWREEQRRELRAMAVFVVSATAAIIGSVLIVLRWFA